jgi:hypothetical protein
MKADARAGYSDGLGSGAGELILQSTILFKVRERPPLRVARKTTMG